MKPFLDSHGPHDWRKPLRTLYALGAVLTPDKIHIRAGFGNITTYNLATFFQRVDGGEQLSFPGGADHGPNPEQILRPDARFNIDGGLRSPGVADNGVEILTGFDVDDRGCMYLAATNWGFAIVNNGAMVWQDMTDHAGQVVAFKAGSRYYALVNTGHLYDVTDRAHPVRLQLPGRVPRVADSAKSSDGSRIAIIDIETHQLVIYDAAGLAANAAPLITGGSYASVTTDGRNFFALSGNTIDVFSPAGNTYNAEAAAVLENFSQPTHIDCHDGYIVVAGSNGPSNAPLWRAYRVNADLTLTGVRDFTYQGEGVNPLGGIVIGSRILLFGKTVGLVDDIPAATAAPTVIPSDPFPQAPNFDDQQEETVTQKYVIRPSELAAKTAVAWLRSRNVTFAMYGQLADGTWKVEWH